MKAFEFKPKLYTALKNYSKELFMADLMAGTLKIHGADNGIRTRDPHLGKVMLYQLSHVRILNFQVPLFGGDARIRTGGEGFAGLCLTTWPRRHPGVFCPIKSWPVS